MYNKKEKHVDSETRQRKLLDITETRQRKLLDITETRQRKLLDITETRQRKLLEITTKGSVLLHDTCFLYYKMVFAFVFVCSVKTLNQKDGSAILLDYLKRNYCLSTLFKKHKIMKKCVQRS
jgi:hypothetical protein